MDVKIKKAISQKTGNEYEYLSIMLAPGLEKKVFLNQAELLLVKAQIKQS